MAVPNLIRFNLHWSGHGEEGTITTHYVAQSMHTEAELDAACGNIDAMWASDTTPSTWDNLVQFLDAGQAFDDLALYQYADDSLPATVLAHRAPSTARAGTGNVNGALQESLCATLLTASAGRRKRGRLYLPGHTRLPGTDVQLPSTQTDFAANTVAGAWGDVMDALSQSLDEADPLPWVVYSRAGRMATAITEVSVDSRLDVQRRRAASQVPLRQSIVVVGS